MALVGIVMGSDSDLKIMARAADLLRRFEVEPDVRIISAHREPDVFFDYALDAEAKGIKVIIAGAGMAAHLPGMCAALFPLPVIGVPLSSKAFGGEDALYSILQMPPGVPVATVGVDNATNAALLALRILAIGDERLRARLKEYAAEQKQAVMEKDKRLQALGVEGYLRGQD